MATSSRNAARCDLALAAVSGGYLAFAYVDRILDLGLPPICPWLLVTDTPCLLCGSTRAIGSWLHAESAPHWGHLAAILWLGFVVGQFVAALLRLSASRTSRRFSKLAS